MLGRAKTPLPVLILRSAGPCETWSPPFIERITQISSMTPPISGKSSLTSIPLWPYLENFHAEASSLPVGANSNFGLAIGRGLPFISASFGLGSNESTCDTPPCMKRKITRLARGEKCDCFGASGFVALAHCDSSCNSPKRATCPKPHAARRSASRRERGAVQEQA